MRLFVTGTSPFARQCRIVVRERHLEPRVTEQAIADDPATDTEYLAANPAGHGPALVCKNGLVLLGAATICRYLDSLGDTPSLQSGGGREVWRAQQRTDLANAATELAVRLKHEQARPIGERSRQWMQVWRDALDRTLEQLALDPPAETPIDLSAIVTAVAVSYLDHRHPDIDWRSRWPALAALLRAIEARPSFQATAPR